MEDFLANSFSKQVPVFMFVIDLIIAFGLSIILKMHFERFSLTISGKKELSRSMPFLVMVVCLIISIVKTSLGLSLGLLGALSMVRFRTPIKDPEELVYLLMCIGLGLGCGANQALLTAISTLIILGAVSLIRLQYVSDTPTGLSLSMTCPAKEPFDIDELNAMLMEHTESFILKRIDENQDNINISYSIIAEDRLEIMKLPKALKKRFPFINVSLIDQNKIPGF